MFNKRKIIFMALIALLVVLAVIVGWLVAQEVAKLINIMIYILSTGVSGATGVST